MRKTGQTVLLKGNFISCSTRLLIKTEIPTKEEDSCFKSLRCCIYHANKCYNANNCYIFEQNKFCAQLS